MRQRGAKSDVDDIGINAEGNSGGIALTARRALKRVDVYPKMHREFRVQTETGATVSVIAGVIMLILFLSELREFLIVHTHEHMVVDSTINEKLRINLDISFLAINCKDAHINAMDVAGDLQMNMHQTITKIRLDPSGKEIGKPISMRNNEDAVKTELPAGYCGSCYDATHPGGKKCCNTCEELKEAFVASDISLEEADQKEQCIRESLQEEQLAEEGEGCRFRGWMLVNRVAGNFHVALGRTFHREGRLVHQFRPGQELRFNSSHIVHSLSFGTPYPGMVNPLDGVKKTAAQTGAVYQYYIKVVPTIYSDISSSVNSYQFSYTQQARFLDPAGQMTALPGTFFVFDLSPFMVKVENDRMPLTHFLTKICAIIGGMISIAGFVDGFIYIYLHKTGGSSTSAKLVYFEFSRRLTINGMGGDLHNSACSLLRCLRAVQYPRSDTIDATSLSTAELLQILHFVFLDYSRHVTESIVSKGYELYGKTDARFVDAAFRLLREEFHYFPSLNSAQFLSSHFYEKKILLLKDVLNIVKKKHDECLRLKRQQHMTWKKPKAYCKSENVWVDNHLQPEIMTSGPGYAAKYLETLVENSNVGDQRQRRLSKPAPLKKLLDEKIKDERSHYMFRHVSPGESPRHEITKNSRFFESVDASLNETTSSTVQCHCDCQSLSIREELQAISEKISGVAETLLDRMVSIEQRLESLEVHVTEISTKKDKENISNHQQPAIVASDTSRKTSGNTSNQEVEIKLISSQYSWPPDPSAFDRN